MNRGHWTGVGVMISGMVAANASCITSTDGTSAAALQSKPDPPPPNPGPSLILASR
jgi:hypothetical protein